MAPLGEAQLHPRLGGCVRVGERASDHGDGWCQITAVVDRCEGQLTDGWPVGDRRDEAPYISAVPSPAVRSALSTATTTLHE